LEVDARSYEKNWNICYKQIKDKLWETLITLFPD
jgi:hypothetical protein